VPPNTIDFNTVFTAEKFLESMPVFCTVAGMIGIYILLIIWARHMDKKDIARVRIIIIISSSYHIVDLKRQNSIKDGTDKPKLKLKMQSISVSDDDVLKRLLQKPCFELAAKVVFTLGRCYIIWQGVPGLWVSNPPLGPIAVAASFLHMLGD